MTRTNEITAMEFQGICEPRNFFGFRFLKLKIEFLRHCYSTLKKIVLAETNVEETNNSDTVRFATLNNIACVKQQKHWGRSITSTMGGWDYK